jgi:hypothetical protein
LFPFIAWIISGLKTYETRNRNTLKRFIGKTVYFAETGKGKRPVIRCSCTLADPVIIDNKKDYNAMRKYTRIKAGSVYDFTENTKRKYLYPLENIQACEPFTLPDNAVYHGRVYATVNE